jgi:hypothetical protein
MISDIGAGGSEPFVTILCEGANDVLLLRRTEPFFESFGFKLKCIECGGIDSLLGSAPELVSRYSAKGPVVLLYDRGDIRFRHIKIIRSLSAGIIVPVLCVPAVQKIEAWLMADTDALYSAFGIRYKGPFPLDRIEDPKRFFLHFCRVAVRKGKRSFLSRESDFFRAVARRWELERARPNNESLDRFCKNFIRKFI